MRYDHLPVVECHAGYHFSLTNYIQEITGSSLVERRTSGGARFSLFVSDTETADQLTVPL